MRLAYMIMAHKNFSQLNMLIRSLLYANIDIYIHIDKKNDVLFDEVCEKYIENRSVNVIQNRVNINRGGFSQVQGILNLMNEVLKKEYDYVSLISAQDYPIKSMNHIKEFLKVNNGKQFIEGKVYSGFFWRLNCYHFFAESTSNRKLYMRIIDNIIRRTQVNLKIRRTNLQGFTLYKGSSWFTVTYDCLKYMSEYVENNPKYMNDYRYTYAPDESFFHIIIMNSKFKETRVDDDLMMIDWNNSEKGSPRVYNINDYDELSKCDKLFARKFDIDVDKNILLKLESHIG